MSSISVKWQSASSAVQMYGSQRTELSNVIASVRGVKSYRCMRGRNFSSIYSALDRVIARLEDEKNDIRILERAASDILNVYKTCENKVESQIKGTNLKEVNSTGGSGAGDKSQSELIKLLLKILGKAGPAGIGISTIGKLLTADWADWVATTKNIVGGLKDINGIIGGVSGIIAKGATASWKDWVGVNNGLKNLLTVVPGGAVGPGAVFKNIFGNSLKNSFDFKLPSGATTADKVKLGTKWAGVALSGITNLVENIDEHNENGIGWGRVAGETVIETATDVAVDAVIGAGVSAAAGAALTAAGLTVSAPAVVIGAATVAVSWAANKGCEWVTEKFFGEKKDIGEVVADGVCDAVEWGAKWVGDRCKSAKQTFTKWGKALFG